VLFRSGRRGVRAGAIACLPALLAVGPFGMIFGIVARESGLDLVQTMVMTVTVIAGASQLAALQLLADGAPVALAILAGAVVNLRLAMYSASLAPWWHGVPAHLRGLGALILHDQSYAFSIARYQRREDTLSDRVGFYFGVGVVTASVWTAMTLVGATLGDRLPADLDLAFMVPVTFISITAPMLRGRRNLAVAGVAAALALAFAWLPYGTGLMVAAAGGIAAGLWLSREAAA
jgi:predicted branched-subunit amino acid permease